MNCEITPDDFFAGATCYGPDAIACVSIVDCVRGEVFAFLGSMSQDAACVVGQTRSVVDPRVAGGATDYRALGQKAGVLDFSVSFSTRLGLEYDAGADSDERDALRRALDLREENGAILKLRLSRDLIEGGQKRIWVPQETIDAALGGRGSIDDRLRVECWLGRVGLALTKRDEVVLAGFYQSALSLIVDRQVKLLELAGAPDLSKARRKVAASGLPTQLVSTDSLSAAQRAVCVHNLNGDKDAIQRKL